MATLTKHDNSILSALFDPEASLSRATPNSKQLPSLPHYSEPKFATIRAEEAAIVKGLDQTSYDLESLQEVICKLSTLIDAYPSYASAYINRAQAARLLLSVDDIFAPDHAAASAALVSDLGKGIDLATPETLSQSVSDHQASVLAAGHTHRGFLLLKAAELTRNGEAIGGAGERLRNATPEQIEEFASRDFATGGRYGNKMARDMSVKTNPYAKMCGAIVKEAMKKEMEESSEALSGGILPITSTLNQ